MSPTDALDPLEDDEDLPLVRWVEPVLVRHVQGGALTIEGGDVVVRLSGERKNAHGERVPWHREFRAPVATAELERRAGQITLSDGRKAVQTVRPRPFQGRELRRFLSVFADAQSAALEPRGVRRRQGKARTCGTCGAGGQVVAVPCHFCGAG